MYTEAQIIVWAESRGFSLHYAQIDGIILVYSYSRDEPFGEFAASYQSGILQGYTFNLLGI